MHYCPLSLHTQVLESIGKQNPALLQAIHANQAGFLALMNEPIVQQAAGAPAHQHHTHQQQDGYGDEGDMDTDMGAGGMPNPLQLMQMLQQMPEAQRNQAAAQLGLSAEQLQQFTQMMATMSPQQLQQMMAGAGAGRAGGPGAGNVIRLSEEEMASVNRLMELGFSQQDAAAAFLSCDKNEALAANLLLEGGWQGGAGDDYEGGGDYGGDYGGDDGGDHY